MALQSERSRAGILEPREIVDLKEIFDEACSRASTEVSPEALGRLLKGASSGSRTNAGDDVLEMTNIHAAELFATIWLEG
jgi:hypothetical protein